MRNRLALGTGLLCLGLGGPVAAETVRLTADGTSDTYRHINWTLAPGGNAVEVPDCGHREFGPHITQAMDAQLGKPVFRFHIHRDHDDDRCKKDDRQRTEIKVYNRSPDKLKGKPGRTFTYRWKFRMAADFQPSRRFTHLHQIKAVGGPYAGMPLVTLSARKGAAGKPDQFEFRYGQAKKQRTLHSVPLAPMLGRWLAVEQRIAYGDEGAYAVRIAAVKTGDLLFAYDNDAIRMWKTDADFQRPKWGIYRSLRDKVNLKDEIVDFADFEIAF